MDSLTIYSMTPGLIAWFSLMAAWLVERYLPISSAIDPIAFFRFICDRMAVKVLPNTLQTQQHYLSGALALVTLAIPAVVIVYLVSQFASYQWLFDAIVLYLCLQFSQHIKLHAQINRALLANKKQLAKDLLKPLVLRDTAMLSALGINKASIEMYTLRLVYQQAVVLFWFILLGPVAALAYRMCFEASQSWNIKLVQLKRFGYLSHVITTAFQWLPVRLFAVLLLAVGLSNRMLKDLKKLFSPNVFFGPSGGVTLAAVASALNKNMSGPVFYNDLKIHRVKFLHGDEPDPADAQKLLALGRSATLVYLCLLLPISWILYG